MFYNSSEDSGKDLVIGTLKISKQNQKVTIKLFQTPHGPAVNDTDMILNDITKLCNQIFD